MNDLAQYMELIVEPTYEEYKETLPLFGLRIWLVWLSITPLTVRRTQMNPDRSRSNGGQSCRSSC